MSKPSRDVCFGYPPDPELADGVRTMLRGLRGDVQDALLGRLAVHLQRRGLGDGAFVDALIDVLHDAGSPPRDA